MVWYNVKNFKYNSYWCGYCIGLILCGVSSIFYTAHALMILINISKILKRCVFGISVILSSIFHLFTVALTILSVKNHLKKLILYLAIQLFTGLMMTTIAPQYIPWKLIFTSNPVKAIAMSYFFFGLKLKTVFFTPYVYELMFENAIIISLLLFVVLVEFIPEMTFFVSITNVRKFWSCTYFVSIGFVILFITINIHLPYICKLLFCVIFKIIECLYSFGYCLNHLDIAPKYASLIVGILLSSNCIFDILFGRLSTIVNQIYNEYMIFVFFELMCLTTTVFYVIYASAEIQPWAVENLEEEDQRNTPKNVTLQEV